MTNQDTKWFNWKIIADKSCKSNDKLDRLLFSFCDSDQYIKVFSDKNNIERKYIHNRCDQLGISHKSKTQNGYRILTIQKPTDWTLQQPKAIIGKLYECQICYQKKSEVYVHWRGFGPYCEECINDDDELQGYKWEPV